MKIQITIVLTALILFLTAQSYLSTKNQEAFLAGITLSQQTMDKVGLVRDLEKDLLDIQRYVLIYKQTASESVIERFNLIQDKINSNLSLLYTSVQSDDQATVYIDRISRMRAHLQEYRTNFENVIQGRSRRERLFEDSIKRQFEKTQLQLEEYQSSKNLSEQESSAVLAMSLQLSEAHALSLEYLLTPDPSIVGEFDSLLSKSKEIMNESLKDNPVLFSLETDLDKLSTDFKQLTQVTRGYLFLINVVMAGSANEFLYLTRELNQLVTENQQRINEEIIQSGKDAQSRNSLFAAISVALAVLTALFFTYRVMMPISEMTELFKTLASGKNINKTIKKRKNNEIGELAAAAQVFQEKNKQTQELLEHSKNLNAKQEKLNQELAISTKKAEEALATKSIFLANMSHEIRTPMNGIIGLVDIVLKSKLDNKQRANLEKVIYSTHILLNLINGILDFSKIEAGKLDIEKVKFSPRSMFENVLANISAKGNEKNLNIQFFVNPLLPVELIGDPMRINQVLLNLCTNAVKFTRNGSVHIHIDFTPLENEQICLKISVKDTGIGMDEAQLKSIFNPFTQADDSTSRKFGGTGLGLTIVKQLVELMHGKITVDSTVNSGSHFQVELIVGAGSLNKRIMDLGFEVSIAHISVNDSGLTPDTYLNSLDQDYVSLSLAEIDNFEFQNKEKSLLLIDIDDIKTHKVLNQHIAKAKEKGMNIGLVTNTQPSTLPSLLQQKWNLPVLSHPFTPRHFSLFILQTLGVDCPYDTPNLGEVTPKSAQLKGHVLLVEDNHINQIVASEMLAALGLTFDVAEDGHQAVTKIVNSPQYDIVLMDIQMPVMDGYEATKQLRRQGFKDLVICGLSANAMNSDFELAFAAGMNDYITKPIKPQMLNHVLSKYLPSKTTDNTAKDDFILERQS
ncbi:ATP-binding protein [Aliiglaciecola sp. 3_MG-2023]|uniref:ATP-binding protein n=1 Tax=Aliiglaciecola sp. 3_MG-2023 TaxID=3062644 RepID=UPI0026E2489E|nr:ATP-binding protein [Aliiglaciecola sp. 3_MG-2023]MDO6692794.1 ATP-binding protein [Aliiglaciecola sp. 3_MG-2023]